MAGSNEAFECVILRVTWHNDKTFNKMIDSVLTWTVNSAVINGNLTVYNDNII